MNGLAWMRAIDWRTSSSRSLNASAAHSGLMPVSSCTDRLNSSSVKVSIPQSVWWMRMISSVPSSRCEIDSERISSAVITPPALQMMWASPSSRPRIRDGISRASMQATTATFLAGGSGSSPLSKDSAYCSALRRSSSVTLMDGRYHRIAIGFRPFSSPLRRRARKAVVAHGARRPRRRRLEALRGDALADLEDRLLDPLAVGVRAVDGDLLVVEHVVVGLLGGLDLPGLACGHRVEGELDVRAQLRRGLGATRLVVDELVGAVGQPVDAVDAAADEVLAEPELEGLLEPHRLAVLGAKPVVVADERLGRLAAQLALLLGVAEAAAPPPRLEQPEQLGQRPLGGAAVEALEHLVDEDPEALVERRLRGDPEHARELVLERAREVGLDVRRAQQQAVAAPGEERLERRLGALR